MTGPASRRAGAQTAGAWGSGLYTRGPGGREGPLGPRSLGARVRNKGTFTSGGRGAVQRPSGSNVVRRRPLVTGDPGNGACDASAPRREEGRENTLSFSLV